MEIGKVYRSIPENKYSGIIINLWSNDKRPLDVIGGNSKCSHINIKNQRCGVCGAYVSHWGNERNVVDYYNHSYTFSAINRSYLIYIIHFKIIPVEFVLNLMGHHIKTKHRGVVYCQDDNLFVNIFSPVKVNPFYVSRNLDSFVNSNCDRSFLFINPRVKDLGYNMEKLICNKDVLMKDSQNLVSIVRNMK